MTVIELISISLLFLAYALTFLLPVLLIVAAIKVFGIDKNVALIIKRLRATAMSEEHRP